MELDIYYFSRTGNLEKFANKIRARNIKNIYNITPNLKAKNNFILIVSTINFGEVPIEYKMFLKENWKKLVGVSGSGNRNWGKNFAIAADIIAKKFDIPLLTKFELSGNEHDIDRFINEFNLIKNS
ncbi:MAG: protein NrdI [Candidatus Tyloplasma litorale]|nr:MAG: protein NrdI [Mycoplasmatales bacterium]